MEVVCAYPVYHAYPVYYRVCDSRAYCLCHASWSEYLQNL